MTMFYGVAYCVLGTAMLSVFVLFFREGWLLGKDIKLLYKEEVRKCQN